MMRLECSQTATWTVQLTNQWTVTCLFTRITTSNNTLSPRCKWSQGSEKTNAVRISWLVGERHRSVSGVRLDVRVLRIKNHFGQPMLLPFSAGQKDHLISDWHYVSYNLILSNLITDLVCESCHVPAWVKSRKLPESKSIFSRRVLLVSLL